jgi:ribosome-associated toxin RatA of RatAB toxin-antitoxin module
MLNRMRKLKVEQEGAVGASAERVYRLIADDQHHQRFLPKGFSDFEVLEGGIGAGTLHRFTVSAGGRTREYTMRVAEPEPGRVITETDQSSSLVTSFTVAPSGDTCRVLISTTWDGAGGVGGFFERLFAPRVLRQMYTDELTRLDCYAREQAAAAP